MGKRKSTDQRQRNPGAAGSPPPDGPAPLPDDIRREVSAGQQGGTDSVAAAEEPAPSAARQESSTHSSSDGAEDLKAVVVLARNRLVQLRQAGAASTVVEKLEATLVLREAELDLVRVTGTKLQKLEAVLAVREAKLDLVMETGNDIRKLEATLAVREAKRDLVMETGNDIRKLEAALAVWEAKRDLVRVTGTEIQKLEVTLAVREAKRDLVRVTGNDIQKHEATLAVRVAELGLEVAVKKVELDVLRGKDSSKLVILRAKLSLEEAQLNLVKQTGTKIDILRAELTVKEAALDYTIAQFNTNSPEYVSANQEHFVAKFHLYAAEFVQELNKMTDSAALTDLQKILCDTSNLVTDHALVSAARQSVLSSLESTVSRLQSSPFRDKVQAWLAIWKNSVKRASEVINRPSFGVYKLHSYTPNSMSKQVNAPTAMHDYRCYHEELPTFPAALIHPAFGIISDVLKLHIDDLLKLHEFNEIWNGISALVNELREPTALEAGLQATCLKSIIPLIAKVKGDTLNYADGGLKHRDQAVMILEVKHDLNTSGAFPFLQAIGYYRDNLLDKEKVGKSQGSGSARVGDIDEGRLVNYRTKSKFEHAQGFGERFPALLLVVCGTHVQVYGAWIIDEHDWICVEPLTDHVDFSRVLSQDPIAKSEDEARLAQFILAIRLGLRALCLHYDGLQIPEQRRVAGLVDTYASSAHGSELTLFSPQPYSPFKPVFNRPVPPSSHEKKLTSLSASRLCIPGIGGISIPSFACELNESLINNNAYHRTFTAVVKGELVQISDSEAAAVTTGTNGKRQRKASTRLPRGVLFDAKDSSSYLSKLASVVSASQGSAVPCVIPSRISFTDPTRVVVKYVRGRYPFDVHWKAAEEGIAPRLYLTTRIPGNYFFVVMEDLSASSTSDSVWMRSDKLDMVHLESFRVELNKVVTTLGRNGWVHGDIRKLNIMARVKGDRVTAVKLIDWDWAGEVGRVKYPYQISFQEPHVGILPGKPIMHEHDVYRANNLEL